MSKTEIQHTALVSAGPVRALVTAAAAVNTVVKQKTQKHCNADP